MDKVNPMSSLESVGSTWVLEALYQVSMSSASWFRRRTFLKVLTIYGLGSHLGQVTLNIWTNFHPNIPWRLHRKFGFKRPKCFLRKEVWKCRIWVSMNGLDLGLSCTHIFDYMYQLSPHRLQHFFGNLQLKHFSIKKKQKGSILTLM